MSFGLAGRGGGRGFWARGVGGRGWEGRRCHWYGSAISRRRERAWRSWAVASLMRSLTGSNGGRGVTAAGQSWPRGYGTVTDTWSNVDLFRAPALCDVTNRPMVTGSVMVMVVVPTWVQVPPSAEV